MSSKQYPRCWKSKEAFTEGLVIICRSFLPLNQKQPSTNHSAKRDKDSYAGTYWDWDYGTDRHEIIITYPSIPLPSRPPYSHITANLQQNGTAATTLPTLKLNARVTKSVQQLSHPPATYSSSPFSPSALPLSPTESALHFFSCCCRRRRRIDGVSAAKPA